MSLPTAKTREKLTCFFARPHSEVSFAREEGGKPKIRGYAAMFDCYSEDLGGFVTRLDRGCFDKVISTADCRMLVNHDPNLLFGRTKSGTLKLSVDSKGLYFECDAPDTALMAHYAAEIERGDMDGCSFTCLIDIDQWDFSGEMPVRTLMSLSELLDVGPVTYPAFRQTSATVSHSLEAARLAAQMSRGKCSPEMMRLSLALAR